MEKTNLLKSIHKMLTDDMEQTSSALKNEENPILKNEENIYKLLVNIISIEIDISRDILDKKMKVEKAYDEKLGNKIKLYYEAKEKFEKSKLDNEKYKLQALLQNRNESDLQTILDNNDITLSNSLDIEHLSKKVEETEKNMDELNKIEYKMFQAEYNLIVEKEGKDSNKAEFVKYFLKSFYPNINATSELPSNRDVRDIVESFESFDVRRIYTKKSWALLTKETIALIVDKIIESGKTKILDIGSGSGALVYWLRKELKRRNINNIEVLGIDDNSWGMSNTPVTNDLMNGDALEYVKQNKNEDSLYIGSWISPKSEFAYEILKEMEIGNDFLYLGEPTGGCTGTDLLHGGLAYVDDGNNNGDWNSILTFNGIHDNIVMYKKTKEINPKIERLFEVNDIKYGGLKRGMTEIINDIYKKINNKYPNVIQKIENSSLENMGVGELINIYENIIKDFSNKINKPELQELDIYEIYYEEVLEDILETSNNNLKP